MVRVRYVGTVRFKIELKYGTLVRYGSRCEVRSTKILNVYRTVLPSLRAASTYAHIIVHILRWYCNSFELKKNMDGISVDVLLTGW